MAVQNWAPYSRQLVHVMRCAVTEWLAHRAASKGAALAFYSLFSLAPILVLVIASPASSMARKRRRAS
jgi:membrane protein